MKIIPDYDLTTCSTMRLPARTRYLAEITTESDLSYLRTFQKDTRLPALTIGGGSNSVFCSDFPGIVVRADFRHIEHPTACMVRVGSGVPLDDFVAWSVNRGLSGIEALSGIPGSIGGAIALNAGAFGQKIQQVIESVRVYDIHDGRQLILSKRDLHYGHRSSAIRATRGGRFIIIDALFRMKKAFVVPVHPRLKGAEATNPESLRSIVLRLRSAMPDVRTKQTVGSFFLNPIITNAAAVRLTKALPHVRMRRYDARHHEVAAGWLLEACELRGSTLHGFTCSDTHANIITAATGTSGIDLARFVAEVRKKVVSRTGILLGIEPLLIGQENWAGELFL